MQYKTAEVWNAWKIDANFINISWSAFCAKIKRGAIKMVENLLLKIGEIDSWTAFYTKCEKMMNLLKRADFPSSIKTFKIELIQDSMRICQMHMLN